MKFKPKSRLLPISQVLDAWLAKSGMGKRLDVSQVVDRWADVVAADCRGDTGRGGKRRGHALGPGG